jgi:hypothetical protein
VGLVEGRDDATLGTPRSRHPRELRSAVRNMVAFSVTDPCFLDCGIGFLVERHRKGSLPHSKLDEDNEVRCSWAWLRPKAQHSVIIEIQVSFASSLASLWVARRRSALLSKQIVIFNM